MAVEINNKCQSPVNEAWLEGVVNIWQKEYDISGLDVSIALVNDEEIKEINKKYRDKDEVTDVLSFPDEENLGEIILNFDQIARQAPDNDQSEEAELIFMLVHGLYHLLGFTDDTVEDRQKMITLGENFINKHKLK